MRKAILTIAALLISFATHAQIEETRNILEVGAGAGANLNSMETQPSIRQGMLWGGNGGISIRYTSEKYFSMICSAQMELNFSQRGMKEDFDDGTTNFYSRTSNYLEIPLFAHLAWGKERRGLQFYLNLGPQFGFLLGESENYHGDWETSARPESIRPIYGKKADNFFDYGIAGGLGVELRSDIGNFFIEGRYYYALADIFKNSKTEDFGRSANKTIHIRAGYSFTIFDK